MRNLLAILLAGVLLAGCVAVPASQPVDPVSRAATGSITAASLAVSGASTLTGVTTFYTSTVLTAAPGGGNAGGKTQYTGLPRLAMVGLGQGTNATLTVIYMDDDPTGECAPVGVPVTEAEGSATNVFRFGASSYAASFTSAAVGNNGFNCTISNTDFQTVENVGAWVYPTVATASGDLAINLIDDGVPVSYTLPALTANTWAWVEVNITALAGGTGNVVSGIGILLTNQGATNLGAFTLYTDFFAKWLTIDSDTLGIAVIQDGILSVINAETGAALVENTTFLARYINAADAIVYMTDMSGADIFVLAAY